MSPRAWQKQDHVGPRVRLGQMASIGLDSADGS